MAKPVVFLYIVFIPYISKLLMKGHILLINTPPYPRFCRLTTNQIESLVALPTLESHTECKQRASCTFRVPLRDFQPYSRRTADQAAFFSGLGFLQLSSTLSHSLGQDVRAMKQFGGPLSAVYLDIRIPRRCLFQRDL